MTKVFIDGSAGTTGLRIYERLATRRDLTLIALPEALRKDPEARREAIFTADVAFLCLPDDAARESVALAEGADTVVIDTSTAHRTAAGWTYGFPELVGREAIAAARRIANPGCHASGAIALIAPLVRAGLLAPTARLSLVSLTGYSGGGKKMIVDYEAEGRDPLLSAPRAYGLSQGHKHLPEILSVCGLREAPVFLPIVAPYYAGMEVTLPLHGADLGVGIAAVRECLAAAYPAGSGLVAYSDADEGGFLSAAALSGRDDMLVGVFGNDERMTLVSRFDNLGKGASGAAIQNMNITLGVAEDTGLILGGN